MLSTKCLLGFIVRTPKCRGLAYCFIKCWSSLHCERCHINLNRTFFLPLQMICEDPLLRSSDGAQSSNEALCLFASAASRGCALRVSLHPWVAASRRAAQGLPVCRSHQSGSRELQQQWIRDRAATPTSRRADTAAWKQQEVGHCSCMCSHTVAFVLRAEACPAAASTESPADGFSQNRSFSQAFMLGLRMMAGPTGPQPPPAPTVPPRAGAQGNVEGLWRSPRRELQSLTFYGFPGL